MSDITLCGLACWGADYGHKGGAMSMLEKLGITPGPWEHVFAGYGSKVDQAKEPGESWLDMRHRIEPELKRLDKVKENDQRLAKFAPQMLEALIGLVRDMNVIYIDSEVAAQKAVIEQATGKTWAEIKELI